jgi:hypothetical protein
MARDCVIKSADGRDIATRVSYEQIYRLRGYAEDGTAPGRNADGSKWYHPVLIVPHKKKSRVYVALVAAAVIQAELKREIQNRISSTEANQTTRWEQFTTPNGRTGRLIAHNTRMIYRNYGPEFGASKAA